MVRKHSRQRPHYRRSRKGKSFRAGRGRFKRKSKYYIPPAWKDVKYHKDQEYVVTGVDKKGRTQYIYPQKFTEEQKITKFKRIDKLQDQLLPILQKLDRDMKKGNQEAQAVYTIYKTGFRPGTEKDTMADKKAYGVATMLKRHVTVKPHQKVIFDFTGKKGIKIRKEVIDDKLHKIIRQRKNNTKLFDTNSTKIRSYFNKQTKGRYQIKDLRTLRANQVASKAMKNKVNGRKEVGKIVASELHNTPTVALGSYINPKIVS